MQSKFDIEEHVKRWDLWSIC